MQKFLVLKYKDNPQHDINMIKIQFEAKRVFRHVILLSIINSAVIGIVKPVKYYYGIVQ